jgi:hypothetical protein
MCQKIRYATRSEAKQAAREAHKTAGNQRPYHCRHCNCWHLTHYSAAEQRQFERAKRRRRAAA